jgi:N-sulfoglucosamine sulfohydrolase
LILDLWIYGRFISRYSFQKISNFSFYNKLIYSIIGMKNLALKSVVAFTPLIFVRCGDHTGTSGERPNILIAIADDISYPHMSAYGCSFVSTPGFDRIAREGILFNNAYTPNAKSSPSRACLLTGRNSWQLEEACNHVPFFPQKFTSFIECLNSHGYFTGYTAKAWAPGIALDSAGEKRELTGRAFDNRKIIPPASGISNNDYAGNFKDFLDARERGKPFCFWYGSYEPHRRYEYGSGVRSGGKDILDVNTVYEFWPDNDTVRNDILDYAYEIDYFDSHLVSMLKILEQRGELDNTLIIVTSDNGMPFPRIKGNAYEYSNHMPLAIRWGKGIRKPGRVVDDLISFIDIAPTILDAAGISESDRKMKPIEGRSFMNILKSRKKGLVDKSRDHLLMGHERHDVGRPDDEGYPVRGIIKDGFLYLRNYKPDRWPVCNPETGYLNTDGSPTKTLILNMNRRRINTGIWELNFGKRLEEELYDIRTDPSCMNNLAGDPDYADLVNNLREQMESELRDQNDPRILGNGDIFDKYPYAHEDVRDFYNRYMKDELSSTSAGWVDSTDFEGFSIK